MSPPSITDSVFILIVDDNNTLRHNLHEFLDFEGYHIVEAESAQAALNLLKTAPTPPHLILLDVLMSGMDGLEFAEFILQQAQWQSIAVVLLSAQEARDLPHPLPANVKAVLFKPVTTAELLATIQQVLHGSSQ